MVAPFLLTIDILSTALFLLLPAGLWLFLYLAAWEHESWTRGIGFGRGTFWLLLPGSLFGTLGNLPFFPWHGNMLAINIGGGLIPVALSVVFLLRVLDFPPRSVAVLLGVLGAESFLMLVFVEGWPDTGGVNGVLYGILPITWPGVSTSLLTGLLILGLPSAVMAVYYRLGPDSARTTGLRMALTLGLTSGVLAATFGTTIATPLMGISSAFPGYLLIPIAAGVIASILAVGVGKWPSACALPLAYATTTFGVLIGADVLRQPPLYGGTSAALYAIGGAGVLDLLYLSGLLAAAVAYLSLRRSQTEPRESGSPRPTPTGEASPLLFLRWAWRCGVEGQLRESVRYSLAAATAAAYQARRLGGLPTPLNGDPWTDLSVPNWLRTDYANLQALAAQSELDPRDGLRAWLTSRWLVRAALALETSRFARWTTRTFAFVIDLAVISAAGAAATAALIVASTGSATSLLDGVPLNAAAVGVTAFGLLYFVLFEALVGRTPGKALLHLEVRARELRPLGALPALVRNLPKLVPLFVIGLGVAVVMVLVLKGGNYLASGTGVDSAFLAGITALILVAVVLVVVGIVGAISVLVIARSPERQRFGDYLAGSWVIRAAPSSPVPGSGPSA
ncbi:MAG: RDD family protein [Thermoplasmata archaeon]